MAGVAEPGESVRAGRARSRLSMHTCMQERCSEFALQTGIAHRFTKSRRIVRNSVSPRVELGDPLSRMAEAVIRKKFPDVSNCFYEWESARRISIHLKNVLRMRCITFVIKEDTGDSKSSVDTSVVPEIRAINCGDIRG